MAVATVTDFFLYFCFFFKIFGQYFFYDGENVSRTNFLLKFWVIVYKIFTRWTFYASALFSDFLLFSYLVISHFHISYFFGFIVYFHLLGGKYIQNILSSYSQPSAKKYLCDFSYIRSFLVYKVAFFT